MSHCYFVTTYELQITQIKRRLIDMLEEASNDNTSVDAGLTLDPRAAKRDMQRNAQIQEDLLTLRYLFAQREELMALRGGISGRIEREIDQSFMRIVKRQLTTVSTVEDLHVFCRGESSYAKQSFENAIKNGLEREKEFGGRSSSAHQEDSYTALVNNSAWEGQTPEEAVLEEEHDNAQPHSLEELMAWAREPHLAYADNVRLALSLLPSLKWREVLLLRAYEGLSAKASATFLSEHRKEMVTSNTVNILFCKAKALLSTFKLEANNDDHE
jgi:hypothetical protein